MLSLTSINFPNQVITILNPSSLTRETLLNFLANYISCTPNCFSLANFKKCDKEIKIALSQSLIQLAPIADN